MPSSRYLAQYKYVRDLSQSLKRALSVDANKASLVSSYSQAVIIVWHRADLRVHDHPALFEAAKRVQGRVVPLFVLDPSLVNLPYSGPKRVGFLLENLRTLDERYRELGSNLVMRQGDPEREILNVARETGAKEVFALRSYEPIGRKRDEHVGSMLAAAGIHLHLLHGDVIHEPGTVLTQNGTPFRIYTPFWNTWSELHPQPICTSPQQLEPHGLEGHAFPVNARVTMPKPGELAAQTQLERFLAEVGHRYERLRNIPAVEGTSSLSPYLHLGVLSPRLALERARSHGLTAWIRELAWRDFFRHVLWFNPQLVNEPFRPEWKRFPFQDNDAALERWRFGQTGIPIVDAGMRQLNETGFMHNRVRMLVASFLIKHLLIDYRLGEAIFNELLIDGDLAANNGNWQWVAGCGTDAAPYFRVFNPVTQGKTFDPQGAYIKRFVPELKDIGLEGSAEFHTPWRLMRPPKSYPRPLISLEKARARFLEIARQTVRQKS